MDYKALIDDETWAFIHQSQNLLPDGATDLTFAERRQRYDGLCAAFRAPRPAGVETEDQTAQGVPIRIYAAGHPTRSVLFFHGGGFALGGLDSHDDLCAEICAQTGYRVIAVDYRLAPEHKHPAAFQDCWTVTKWVAENWPDKVLLAGDSAGGGLAASVAHHSRDRLDRILGQVLIYPLLGSDMTTPSYTTHADAPMLSRQDLVDFRDARLTGDEPQSDPTYAALQDTSFAGLPPTVLFSAGCDPLRDDARLYHDHLQNAGTPVHWVDEPGLIHGYLRARHSVTRARDSFERISVAIEALGQELWGWD